MMANAKKCDICGKLYDDPAFDYERMQHIKVAKESYRGDSNYLFDFCDDCYHKLLKFLHEDGEKNGHH